MLKQLLSGNKNIKAILIIIASFLLIRMGMLMFAMSEPFDKSEPKSVPSLKTTITDSLSHYENNPLKVKWINLSNHELSQFPAEILQFKNLISIDLSNNNLKTISADIVKLTKLQILNLKNNQLSTLPENFHELKKLIWLNVNGNFITETKLDDLSAKNLLLQIKR